MGTYARYTLKDKSEENIDRINTMLESSGYPTEYWCGVRYGAFVSMKQLEEDARHMNEDPEGRKQAPGIERPVTTDVLQQFFWLRLGERHIKISSMTPEDESCYSILQEFYKKNKALFEEEECQNV